jgi:hypothetical protein
VIRFKSGAYTIVREHFEVDHNTAIGQKIRFYFFLRKSLNRLALTSYRGSVSQPQISIS